MLTIVFYLRLSDVGGAGPDNFSWSFLSLSFSTSRVAIFGKVLWGALLSYPFFSDRYQCNPDDLRILEWDLTVYTHSSQT